MNVVVGQRIGRLYVAEYLERIGYTHYVLCDCDCGARKRVSIASIKAGTRSCGCLLTETLVARRKHAQAGAKTRAYTAWINMRGRCLNANNKGFANYGGRGIGICERWSEFVNFFADMGAPPPGGSLDRVDPNAGYSPTNCRWASASQQAQNKRSSKLTADIVNEIRGRFEHGERVSSIARRVGVTPGHVRDVVCFKSWSNVP